MSTRKSLLIIGRLPCSPLFKCIQGNHAVTHIPTKGLSRTELATRLSSLSTKSYTVVLVVAETQHLYPLDKTLFSPLSIGCLCKVGAGYDPIDVDYFTSRGTWVANNPVSVRIPTAEWCVSLILATVKGLGEVDRKVRAGRWREGLELRSNITGMTLGVVGLGAIGKEVVKRMNGWGVKVIYSNRTKLPSSEEEKLGARYVPLATLLAESDIITLHCPLTPDTRHLFNSKILAQCKKGVYIINTSRGPVIDERALIQALESGQVKRAGLDVFEREPTIESDLFSNNNVILSPHYAAFTHECSMSLFMSLTKVADMDNELLENALAYIETGKPNTPVNNPRASL